MSKIKILIVTLIHIALAIFFMMAIWPALNSDNAGYSGAVPVSPIAVTEEVDAPVVEDVVVEDVQPNVEDVVVVSDTEVVEVEQPISENDKENEDESALYSVVEGNKLDENSYAGFKLYRNWCARCHGTYGQGMVGPNLADSLKVITEKQFFDTVENGKSGTIGSMPAWKANVQVMEGRDQLYAYLMARSDGAIGEVKPKKQ